MSIQKKINQLESEINRLKTNDLAIEEQVEIYNNALITLNKTKEKIEALKLNITIIEKKDNDQFNSD